MFSVLLLLINFSIGTSEITEQSKLYQSNIESGTHLAESVWALSRLYHSADSTNKEVILNTLSNKYLKAGLDEQNDEFSSVYSLNKHYHDEELLLFLLLQKESVLERENLFEEFYTKYGKYSLKKINELAKQGKTIPEALLNIDKFSFSYYLISYYDHINNISNEQFFNDYASYWTTNFDKSDFYNLKSELHLVTIINQLYVESKFDEIGEFYESVNTLNKIPYSIVSRNLFWYAEFSLYQIGAIDKSLEIQRQHLLPIAEYLGNKSFLNRFYSSHGGYLILLGRYAEARDIFEIALNLQEDITSADLVRLYNNLSLVYFYTGESSKYISTQLKALEHAESIENLSHILTICRNLHIFYRKNKNWELANRYLLKAEKLALETRNFEELMLTYVSNSIFENEYLNNHVAAIDLLEKAESYFSSETDIRTQVRVLYEKAKLYRQIEQYSESKDILRNIISDWSSELNRPTYLDIILQLAEMEYRTGNHREAKRQLREFRAHDISVVVFPKLVQSKTLQAKLSSYDGNFNEAEELYSQTAEWVLERARNSADFESGYWMVEQEYLDLFESYADFLLERNRNPEALTLLDNVKTINDAALKENPLVKSSRLTEEELAKERQINQQMDRIRKKLFTASGPERMQHQNDLERLNAQRRELTRNLNVEEAENLPLWSLQRKLSGNQMLFHITEINDHYYISRVTRSDINIEKKEVTDNLKTLFEGAIGGMVAGQTDLNKLYEVGQFLKLNTIQKPVHSLIVMADGYFHQLPIDVIPLVKPDSPNSYGSALYAIEKFTIRHVNQLSDLAQKRSKKSFESDFSGFGISDFQNESTNRNLISLPKAPGEVDAIAEHLQRFQNKHSFTETAATPKAFESHAGNSRILHMASHSEVSESDPLFSRLHLSPSADENSDDVRNQIFAYELFDLNLQNELIMLNSCDSGAGRYLQGSGIMGISRALRYAGAQSLVLNAWSVNDQFAADFAEVFYQQLNMGESKSIALQKTKIEFMQSKNADPHYWGPYILNGSDAPLINRAATNKGNWVLAFTFFAGLVFVSRQKITREKAA